MAYQDFYRLSVHAVITDSEDRVLFLKTTYGAKGWTLPGGAIDPGETIHEALARECLEELSSPIEILYLSGVYFHQTHNSHAFVFRCKFIGDAKIKISNEHSEWCYLDQNELKDSHKIKIADCLGYNGKTVSRKF